MQMFVAGADVVRWELIALTPEGPYRLTMHHPRGSIVEYFKDATTALNRETELRELLIVIGKHGQADPTRTWLAASTGVN